MLLRLTTALIGKLVTSRRKLGRLFRISNFGFRISCLLLLLISTAQAQSLHLTQTIPLPNIQGRIDHMALDPDHHRLIIAALGNNSVEVIDLQQGAITKSLPHIQEPQGVAYLPTSHKLAITSGGDNLCLIYDTNFNLLGTIPNLDDADNVRYDAPTNLLYVGHSHALAIIDPDNIKKLADIPLAGHPESFQLEATGPRIFINIPTAHQVTVLDRQQHKLLTTWPIKEASDNFPMALDEQHHRLFLGCRHPAKLLVLDTTTGQTLTSTPCCGDTDDLFYDQPKSRIYLTGGEGCVNIIQQQDPDHYAVVDKLPTHPGARTSLWDPTMQRLYIAAPHRANNPATLLILDVINQ